MIYPKGGPETIIKSIISTINNFGGIVLTKAKVDEIIIENNNVRGVKV